MGGGGGGDPLSQSLGLRQDKGFTCGCYLLAAGKIKLDSVFQERMNLNAMIVGQLVHSLTYFPPD